MNESLQDSSSIELERLSRDEEVLETRAREADSRLSGLKDLDVLLRLARVKLSLCLRMMERIGRVSGDAEVESLRNGISEKALAALGIIDGLMSENVSEDQRGAVAADPMFAPLKVTLEEFLVKGGGGFLEAREMDAQRRRALARGIVASIRKFAGDDDRYPPLELENYPPLVRRILLTIFPVLVKEHPQKPPYGIEEGEEVLYSSKKMKLPVSQAIFYMENELLPELLAKLEQSPGDAGLQERIAQVRERVEDYKKLRFFPRSIPVLLEKGYYTEGMTSYTTDGEMLVPIPLPVTMRSGTNLDRRMELVRADLVRRLAGKGICAELDIEYKRLKSLDSGLRGSSRTASLKIDARWGFQVLRKEFPSISRLEDKTGFAELEDLASRGGAGASIRRVSALIEKDSKDLAGAPALRGISRSDPF